MSVRFELDYEDVRKLEEKLSKIPQDVEKLINETLHTFGVREVEDAIITRIPVSKKSKKHAKNSRPIRSTTFNLGFEVKPKRPYWYLVFPDQALGTSVEEVPHEFMREGMDARTDRILEEINRQVDRLLEEEF
ncbi:hypothetical protein [Halobacillus salinus]|uniref:HK97 gp10 family phage protein n=1 Tax=Halobacillus salinus TaxID=192814 RepID=A0A4Z0H5I1_9BACI|nr:hypothetical protein [Halobacillus salinus]TGB04691.1 hypothetical protein E4663_06785 [Halobacillus salinus]